MNIFYPGGRQGYIRILEIRASCKTCEKFKSIATAASFSHSGMVRVFFTDRLLYIFLYSKVSQAIKFINSLSEREMEDSLDENG